MRRILLAAMVVGVVAHGQHAGAQALVSLASFGSAGNDGVTSIASRNGVVAVAGIVGGAMDGQAYAGGTSDGFVRAYDAAGQLLWTRLVGTPQDDTIADVAIDTAGNIYVAGRTGTSPQAGFQQGFVAKLDVNGTPLWHQLLGEGLPSALATTPADQVVVVGYTNGPMGGQTHAGGHDAFIARLDPDGTLLTVRLYGSASEEEFLDVAIDPVTGETYVGGSVQTFAFQIDGLDIAPIGGGDGFVVKFAAAGTAEWVVRIAAETLVPDGIRGLALRPGGGVVATGFTMGALPTHSMSGLVDGFLVAMSALGAVDWSHQFGTASGYVDPAGVAIAADGDLFLTGRVSDLSGISRASVWARNSVGHALWTHSIAGDGSSALALAFSPGGPLIVGGITNEPQPSHHEPVSDSGPSDRQAAPQSELGGTDAFVAIIDTATVVDPPPPPPGPTLTVTRTGNGTGVVSSAPSGISCGANCVATFGAGTPVMLMAVADQFSQFVGWSGACSGTGWCALSALDGPKNVEATFTRPSYSLTVARTGTGGGVVSSAPSGIECGASCASSFDSGTLVTLNPIADSTSIFTGWSGSCTGSSGCHVTVDGNKTVIATFTRITFALTVTVTAATGGTVSSSPAGIACGTGGVCTASFAAGTMVTLTPTAAAGATLLGWTGCDSVSVATCTIAMNAAKTIVATFAYPLTVARAGTGGGIVTSSPGGISCGADCTESFNAGTAVTLTTAVDSTSTFEGWSGACTGTGSCAVTTDAAKTVIATFTRLTSILTVARAGTGAGTITSSPSGIVCGATCTAPFTVNSMVDLTATSADAGSSFTSWAGPCDTVVGNMCRVAMVAARSVTATFSATTYPLTVTRAGTGTGLVISNPAGINCGSDCAETFNAGTLVTLINDASGSSVFSGWSGACTGTGACVVTMDAAKSVTATFTATTFPLTVTRAGTGAGFVISNPSGISCGSTCVATFPGGTLVTLAHDPSGPSVFSGWSGACSGTGACVVAMDAAKSVTATFTATAYPLTVTRVGTGTGLVISNPTGINCGADCVETYNGGTIVTLAVDASGTSTFAGWSGACTGMAACAVTMTAARSVAATFMLPVVVPAISIVDIRIGEGSAGVATVLIPVTLDRPTSVTVKIAFAILPATADATDVRLDKGTVTFEPGQTTQQIVAFVNGDKLVEPKETFTVSLDSAVNATILKGSATITIVDDDIDTIAPEIGAKTAVVVEVKMASTGTVAVTYAAPEAKDGRDGAVPVVCAPASGTKLPYGTTPVTCLAEDKAGNLSSISFQIVVRLPTVAGAIFDKSSPAAPLTEVHAAQHVLVRVNAGAFAPRAKVTLSFLDASGREFHLRAGHAAADGSLDLDAVIPEKAALGGGQVFAVSGSDAEYDRAWLVTVTPPQR